ncbi:PREDICTED: uncharacterized protein LOC108763347 [Trachymyrmex cornetzi]|uniref:MADF domain-containing protein n=1 Tax=Trachymyrmex cornetzi TaxID=471704 RepID=A0A151JQQ7_9HYME|nr:PREDICTED: uncharacterized protein LOC108763347 [Trachymyrmex cornetzi]XP_018366378.1 PREDICTED: uncharacterized protein LOC108763347 [Trachymyrmex cornetzi]KYN29549.1 hypothetical protein ALC57_01014 [Trachymyrmex cornetzi]
MTLQGYIVSSIQVENKYKSLKRSYKNTVTHNKKTGRNRLSCPYETELTELLSGKHNIEPLLLSGNKGIILRNDGNRDTSLSICNENNCNIINTNVQIKAKQHAIGQ